jgi:hypothetical protein
MASGKDSFSFRVDADSVEVQKFKLNIRDNLKNEWTEFFDITFKKDLPEIKDFEIADGKVFTVAKAGIDSATVKLGRGNGDGIANPGESIAVLVRDQKKLWRTEITFSDLLVNPFGVNARESDNWGEYDHVGGSAKYNIPLLSSDCPQNHSLNFFVEYWLPNYPYHIIKQGVVKINVSGKDRTPPELVWAKLAGDNSLQVNLKDGSKIQSARAKLALKSDPSKSLEVVLKDDGLAGDLAAADNVFSCKISQQTFGTYEVVIEAVDSSGNRMTEEPKEEFILH